MKHLLLLFTLLLFAAKGQAQPYDWAIPTDPFFSPTTTVSDVLMHNGRLFHVYDSAGNTLKATVYNPATGTWSYLGHIANPQYNSKIQLQLVGNELYIVAQSSVDHTLFRFDLTTHQFTNLASVPTGMPSSNWEFRAGSTPDQLYLLHVSNYSYLNITHYNTATQAWDLQDITTVMNPTADYLYGYHLELYLTNTEVYVGLSGTRSAIGVALQSNLAGIAPYNSAGSNDVFLRMDGAVTTDVTFCLTGDGQTAPVANIRSNSLVKTWEKPVTTSDIQILSATDPALDFNVTPSYETALADPAYSFLVSAFSGVGSASPADKCYLYRKDLTTGVWDSIGPKIEQGTPTLTSPFRLSLDNGVQHMGLQYASMATGYSTRMMVLNRRPYLGTGSTNTNTGICVGHANEIYPLVTYNDTDNDSVRIVSLSSLGGVITNLSWIGSGIATGGPVISKFKLYGTFTSSVSDRIVIGYTDGWNTYYDTLPPISTSAAAPNVTFSESPLYLCNNENLIDLSHYVSYFDAGVFTLNGQVLSSPMVNGETLSQTTPNGTLYYRTSVNGCFVETGVSFAFVTAGTAVGTATPADCGTTNGTAQVNFTPGTSTNTTVEWSTGETTTTIANLAPGAYYYAVTDEYGCHTTGLADVNVNGISVTPTITNVSCAGLNDGSISVAVTSPSAHQVIWSDGYSVPTITHLAPGDYEVTVLDASGCHETFSYTITEPAPITASFTSYEPDCGLSNGIVYGTYTGGGAGGGLSYNWLGTGQTGGNLTNVPHGSYEVQVSDVHGCVDTFSYQLDDYQAADIHDSVVPTHCGDSDGAIFITFTQDANGGTLPASFTWSNGASQRNNLDLAAGTYTITAASGPVNNRCYSAKTLTVGTEMPLKQEICMVTVDSATTTNIVVWEKVETTGIDHYNIYRENAVAGHYMLIDTVDFDNESLFNDVVVSPLDRSWRYKISAVNVCGVESATSTAHKTVHLNSIVDLGNGSMDIYWDDYEGQTAAEYVVWRHTDLLGWEALSPTVPFGTSVYNDVPPSGSTGLDYYVDMAFDFPCTAQKNQDFNSARSNKDKGQFSVGNGTGDSNDGIEELVDNATVLVYPNPFNDQVTIEIAQATQNIQVNVFSISGQLQQTGSFGNGTNELDLSQLQPGIYLLQLGSSGNRKQLVKL